MKCFPYFFQHIMLAMGFTEQSIVLFKECFRCSMFVAYYNSSCANSEEWHTVWMILGKLDTEGAINKGAIPTHLGEIPTNLNPTPSNPAADRSLLENVAPQRCWIRDQGQLAIPAEWFSFEFLRFLVEEMSQSPNVASACLQQTPPTVSKPTIRLCRSAVSIIPSFFQLYFSVFVKLYFSYCDARREKKR